MTDFTLYEVFNMEETKTRYVRWGNNEFHDPSICEDDCPYNCSTCSNGPRGDDYKRAEARRRIEDEGRLRFAQEMGYIG